MKPKIPNHGNLRFENVTFSGKGEGVDVYLGAEGAVKFENCITSNASWRARLVFWWRKLRRRDK